MSIVLLSPNPGAEAAASDLLPFLAKNRNNGSHLGTVSIQEIRNGKETTEEKTDRLLLAPVSHLFVVEQLCMPSNLENGTRVIVYKTTIRIGSRTYIAVRYTNTRSEGWRDSPISCPNTSKRSCVAWAAPPPREHGSNCWSTRNWSGSVSSDRA